jgi:hypothetical protein
VKFLRHLAAAALVVAVVVAAGLTWGHFADGLPPGLGPAAGRQIDVPVHQGEITLSPGARPGHGRPPPGVHIIGPGGGENLGLNSMFQAVNLPVLRNTLEIEAAVTTGVVLLEIGHRRWRRARRATRLTRPRPLGPGRSPHQARHRAR